MVAGEHPSPLAVWEMFHLQVRGSQLYVLSVILMKYFQSRESLHSRQLLLPQICHRDLTVQPVSAGGDKSVSPSSWRVFFLCRAGQDAQQSQDRLAQPEARPGQHLHPEEEEDAEHQQIRPAVR